MGVRRLSGLLVAAAAVVAFAAACLGAGSARAGTGVASPAGSPPLGQGIRVRGNHLSEDGAAWIPEGVQIVGLVAPRSALRGRYAAAGAHFSAAELSAIKARGANVVRFQVSEFGLDPESPLYSRDYVQQVEDAVYATRNLGLAVIVSLQAEPQAGEPVRCPLPDAGAERVWNELAPMFAGDNGVMFELYNEPAVAPTTVGWQKWLFGGRVGNARVSCTGVGMQSLIDDIRSDGADNVIIVPGLTGEQTLAAMPQVWDPASPLDPQLAYGIHYPSATQGSRAWDRKFGDASASVPVIVTEWDLNGVTRCVTDAPAEAQLLLDYLASKQIGIVGFAFDVPGTIVANWSYAPTSYGGFACGKPGRGPGRLLFDQFGARAGGDGRYAWIVTAATVRGLAVSDSSTVQRSFDARRTFVIGTDRSLLGRLSISQAVPTAAFTDERALAAAVQAGALPAGTRALLYEDTRSSPGRQQLHPAKYYRQAASVAHRHRLMLIADPATDLVATLAPHTRHARLYPEFLRRGIVAAAARYADVYEVQAQGRETSPGAYSAFVWEAAAQARRAHPGVELLAGLAPVADGRRQTARALLDAALATQPWVSGFALAGPFSETGCPSCAVNYPDVIDGFLRAF